MFGFLKNKKYLIMLLVAIIFVFVAMHAYKTYVAPALSRNYVSNKEFIKGSDDDLNKTADLYFFYTEWCPHCKKAKPEWEQLKMEYENKQINGYKINFIEVDCDQNKEIAEQYNVEGYPTIKLVSGNQIVEYDAQPNKKTLEQYLATVLK